MSIQLIDCPACGSKISSQAGACPHCGHPIRPILCHQDKTNLFVAENFKLNIYAGIEAIIIQGVIVFFMVCSLIHKFLTHKPSKQKIATVLVLYPDNPSDFS